MAAQAIILMIYITLFLVILIEGWCQLIILRQSCQFKWAMLDGRIPCASNIAACFTSEFSMLVLKGTVKLRLTYHFRIEHVDARDTSTESCNIYFDGINHIDLTNVWLYWKESHMSSKF